MAYKSNRREIDAKIERACLRTLDTLNAMAVADAKPNTPVVTGTAQGSINFKPARVEGEKFVGEFGSYDVYYFIFLELGTRFIKALHILLNAANRVYQHAESVLKQRMREEGL